MSVLYVLVPAALLLVLAAVLAFVWAARHGQFDDTTTPAWRAMMDDDAPPAREPGGSARDRRTLRERQERVRS